MKFLFCFSNVINRYTADTQKILNRCSTDTQQILNRYSTDTQQILNRYSTDAQQIFNRYSTDTQQIRNRYSTYTQQVLNRYSKQKKYMFSHFQLLVVQICLLRRIKDIFSCLLCLDMFIKTYESSFPVLQLTINYKGNMMKLQYCIENSLCFNSY